MVFLGSDPLGEELLSLGVGLDQDGVLVKLEIVHCLEAGENRLDAVELGQAKRLGFIRVGSGALPRN